ncbi:MAG: HEPN domain-containing protein [Bacteroidales bacterium]|nr:HEPN domain-containing protein [Bacteroidales bacterium]
MKRTLPRMPQQKRKEILQMLRLLLNHIRCEMLILHGYYAQSHYKKTDGKFVFDLSGYEQNHCDILVIISTNNVGATLTLIDKAKKCFDDLFGCKHTRFQFTISHINTINKKLETRRLFISKIKEEGIKLYDSCNFKLSRRRKINFQEIKRWAENDFHENYNCAVRFYKFAQYAYDERDYKLGSFMLHQVAEHCFQAINLVFTNDKPKLHDLQRLREMTLDYSDQLYSVFAIDTPFGKRCFSLLCRSYIEARYNSSFKVKKTEFEYLNEQILLLREKCKDICLDKINSYNAIIYG